MAETKVKIVAEIENGWFKEYSLPYCGLNTVQIGRFIVPIKELGGWLKRIYGLKLVEIKGIERTVNNDTKL